MKTFLVAISLSVAALASCIAADSEEGFITIFDGKSFDGWKRATENTNTWKIEDGAFVTRGNRCHLFYVGDDKPFKNFELKVDVMTETNSNGGIYFHTKYQENGWPKYGFEFFNLAFKSSTRADVDDVFGVPGINTILC